MACERSISFEGRAVDYRIARRRRRIILDVAARVFQGQGVGGLLDTRRRSLRQRAEEACHSGRWRRPITAILGISESWYDVGFSRQRVYSRLIAAFSSQYFPSSISVSSPFDKDGLHRVAGDAR